ncbi:hypothetical protein Zmor_005948 [Zophobas morio]|uniref:Uncharacterized protein n=1 Tax=Zophobas morio TaxID=2755281 RepID=A0AA38IWN6_9CUCU|nr:hypothetical protein Zmor_005948 [Zophobas morio]
MEKNDIDRPGTSKTLIEENCDSTKNSPILQQSITVECKTPEQVNKHSYEDKEKEGYKIPTPFKKCLVFPSTSDTITPKRKRTVFPAVVSSVKYREYYEKEMKKKLIPKKKKKVSRDNENSSDSDVNLTYNDDDLDFSENEDLNLQIGQYVIMKYEKNYYPDESYSY